MEKIITPQQRYNLKHKDRIFEQHLKYYKEHREQIIEYSKKYYRENREMLLKKSRLDRKNNPIKYRKYCKKLRNKHLAEDPKYYTKKYIEHRERHLSCAKK